MYDPEKNRNKYGLVVVNIPVGKRVRNLGELNLVTEGQNEHGLSISIQVMTQSKYERLPEDGVCAEKKVLLMHDLIPYLLGHAKTSEEAVELLNHLIVHRPERVAFNKLGAHWMIADASGEQYIVEYLDQKRVVHKSDVGVMTNDPPFSWHIFNVNNYGHVMAPKNKIPDTMQVTQPSNVYPHMSAESIPGNKAHEENIYGLPGDGSSSARFLGLFYRSKLAHRFSPPQTFQDALTLATHLINTVAKPLGTAGVFESLAYEKVQMVLMKLVEKSFVDYVSFGQWTVLKVPKRNKFYYRDYYHTTWKEVNLNTLDFSETVPVRATKMFVEDEPFTLLKAEFN